MSKDRTKRTEGKQGERTLTDADVAADLDERIAFRAEGQRRGVSMPALPPSLGLVPPSPRERAEHVRELLATAEIVVGTLRAVSQGKGWSRERDRPAMVSEGWWHAARTLLATVDHLRLAHVPDDAFATLVQRFARVDLKNAETLAREALKACGVDARTAARWLEHADRENRKPAVK